MFWSDSEHLIEFGLCYGLWWYILRKKGKKKELCFSCRAYSFLSSMYTICTVYYSPLISHGRRNQLSGVTPQNMASLHLLSHLNMPTTMFWEGTSSFSASNFWWWRSTRICRQQTPMQPSCSWELFRTQGESSWWWRTRRWLWCHFVCILLVFWKYKMTSRFVANHSKRRERELQIFCNKQQRRFMIDRSILINVEETLST